MAEMIVRLKDIAQFLEGDIEGDESVVITGMKPLNTAGPGDISFLDNDKYLTQFRATHAGAVLVGPHIAAEGKTVVRCAQPYAAFARLLQHFALGPTCPFEGVSPQAFVAPDAALGPGVCIGPGAYVAPGVAIGAGTHVWPGVSIGAGCTIGECCRIYSNVTIYHGCEIGSRCVLHAGSS